MNMNLNLNKRKRIIIAAVVVGIVLLLVFFLCLKSCNREKVDNKPTGSYNISATATPVGGDSAEKQPNSTGETAVNSPKPENSSEKDDRGTPAVTPNNTGGNATVDNGDGVDYNELFSDATPSPRPSFASSAEPTVVPTSAPTAPASTPTPTATVTPVPEDDRVIEDPGGFGEWF